MVVVAVISDGRIKLVPVTQSIPKAKVSVFSLHFGFIIDCHFLMVSTFSILLLFLGNKDLLFVRFKDFICFTFHI